MPKPPKRKGETTQERVSRLIRHYIEEGYPQKQAIAIAYNQARKEGRKIPKKRSKRNKSRRKKH